MKLGYDNYEDVKGKLHGTYCLYKGRAVLIKAIIQESDVKYIAHGSTLFNGRVVAFDINDPDFNCSNYNIGYVNNTKTGAWFYRVPLKQYHQGLRSTQVRMKYSDIQFSNTIFNANRGVCAMLENSYPSIKSAAESLQIGDAAIVAFHKNFAMTYDQIHKDFLLEYKGGRVGFTKDLKNMQLMEEREYLSESLKEAIG